jgi:3-phenylpropionate/cinnamic acid dioxygenase small subunit
MEAADEHPPCPCGETLSYVDDAFYEKLVAAFSDWQRVELEVQDVPIREQCRALLEREARLLDQGLYREWLELYAPECVVWVPTAATPGDPRREVSVFFDDRRRLEDRIYRLGTGAAWSQVPPSRTVRFVSNVEAFRTEERTVLMVRSNLLLSEFRAGETRLLAGWCGHRLRRRQVGWEIEAKQLNLIERDQSLRNPSALF